MSNALLRKVVAAAAIATLALGTTGMPAHAQRGAPLFGLRPSLYGKTTLEEGHFQYAVKAGNSMQDAVEVLNLTNEELKVDLYPADMVHSADGSLSPAQADEEMTSVGDWIELERGNVTVPAKGKRYVSFTVSIPKGTTPGDHLGAVVGSVKTEKAADGLTVESRVALIARVKIPGSPVLDVDIGPLQVTKSGSAPNFSVELRNEGNLLFTAKGTVDVSDGSRRVASVVLSPPDVYLIPNGKARFTANWQSPPLFGDRTAVASFDTVTPEEELRRISSDPVSVSFFSWMPVLLGLVIVLLGLFLLNRRRRMQRGETGIPRRILDPDPVSRS